MYKNIMLIIFLFSLFVSSGEYAYANEQVCISSDGTPNHKIGKFPTRGNPHKFKRQKIKFCFPKNPIKTDKNKYIASVVGVTITGIPIRPGTADWYDKKSPRKHSKDQSSGLNLEAIRPFEKIFGIDDHNGHVDHRGLYHYHKSNLSLLLNDEPLIGYAADGFEILYIPEGLKPSWQLKEGERKVEPFGKYDGSFKEDYEFVEGSGNLDECNGKFIDGIFKYFATESFPFFPRCHWGEISIDFIQKRK